MKILVFDLWGDYGHFRVPFTTSSPLTFPFPPKTALYGIVSAILGYDKNIYLKKFQNEQWKFAVSLRSSFIKTNIPENLINTKNVKMFARMPKGKSCRTQSNIEFLKSPYFRVYVISSNKKELIRLAQMLDEHKSVYTVVLGLSECIANFKFIGMFEGKFFNKNNNFINIASVIPLCCIRSTGDINFLEEGKKFLKIHMPTEFNQKRELTNSKNFVFEAEGKTISVKVKEYVTLEELGENVIFF